MHLLNNVLNRTAFLVLLLQREALEEKISAAWYDFTSLGKLSLEHYEDHGHMVKT